MKLHKYTINSYLYFIFKSYFIEKSEALFIVTNNFTK